jgi:hypothetical protein
MAKMKTGAPVKKKRGWREDKNISLQADENPPANISP